MTSSNVSNCEGELNGIQCCCAICVHHGETSIHPCVKHAHEMSTRDDSRRVHSYSPEYLLNRLDAIADLFDKGRADLLVAICEYIEDTTENETFQESIAAKYYDDQLAFETVKQLVGAETAQRLRLLKADVERDPLVLSSPTDADIYDEHAETVGARSTSEMVDDR